MAPLFRLVAALTGLITLTGCSSVYFNPTEPWLQNPANQGLAYEDVVLIHEDGLRLSGWWLPAEDKPKGTVYFLHGNAQNMSTHLAGVQWLPAAGYNVFLLDYRGYGLSEGKPELVGALDDIQLGLDWLNQSGRVDADKPLIVFGQSLGAALSINVLAREENQGQYSCGIFDAGFASYQTIAKEVMRQSWLLWPLRWLTGVVLPGQRWDPINHIAQIQAPVLIMHSPADQVVPYHHGQELFAKAQEPKTFYKLHGAHIADVAEPATQQKVLDFIEQACR